MEDEKFMRVAISLAKKAEPLPNPRVGAVIVKNGRVIASGYHHRAGDAHAEVDALRKLRKGKARGSTIYVTLEPCSHYGRVPPCTKAIIEAGISRVVYAVEDPTRKVKGAEELKKAGIEVKSGILKKEAQMLNPAFYKVAKMGMPFVTLKAACSLDGKIASKSGESKWISSPASRKLAHWLRAKNEGIIAGIKTVLADNPRLTARMGGRRDPVRIILDSKLRVPLDAKVLAGGKAVVAANIGCDEGKKEKLGEMGVKVLLFSGNGIPLRLLLKKLASMNITSVLVEGGGETNAGFVEQKLVDRYYFFVCPKIIGGRDAKSAVEGEGISKISKAQGLVFEKVDRIGKDVLIVAVPEKQAKAF